MTKRIGFASKKQLVDALAEYNDNDYIVIEVHEGSLGEDLYQFDIDVIDGVTLPDGSTGNEIRLCPIPHE